VSEQIVFEAAALRGAGEFAAAIALIESNLANLTSDSRIPGLLQAFYSAHEAGMKNKARELAHMIAAEEPGLPSIGEYL
jgi:hypothetical protein